MGLMLISDTPALAIMHWKDLPAQQLVQLANTTTMEFVPLVTVLAPAVLLLGILVASHVIQAIIFSSKALLVPMIVEMGILASQESAMHAQLIV